MKDLAFLSNANKLKQLEVYYSPSLIDIRAIRNCEKLEKLVFDHCKNIEGDYRVLSTLEKLSFLNITDNKEIKSLSFIKSLHKLKHFAFLGTNVVDGDLSPCLKIEHVGFNNKKHYSHRYEDINKVK